MFTKWLLFDETMLFGSNVLLLRFPLWFIDFSVEELNLTIIVEFILDLLAFMATTFILLSAVMPD